MKNKLVTSDIYLAAALLSLGSKLEDVDKSDARHMQFTLVRNGYKFESENLPPTEGIVSNQTSLDIYEKEWVNGTLMVNAVSFKNAIQQMKSTIHSK